MYNVITLKPVIEVAAVLKGLKCLLLGTHNTTYPRGTFLYFTGGRPPLFVYRPMLFPPKAFKRKVHLVNDMAALLSPTLIG